MRERREILDYERDVYVDIMENGKSILFIGLDKMKTFESFAEAIDYYNRNLFKEERNMKYLVVYAKGDEFVEEFDSKEEAFKNADYQWSHLTKNEKRNCEFYVLESANADEEAENHMDGDVLREYTLENEEKRYIIIDDRLMEGDSEKYSDRMTLDDVKYQLGEEFEDCISDFDINDMLREQNDGMAGYRVVELPIWE